ncbi:putative hydrolase or acyltransferase of alpha/beta superfamily [Dendrothele bispora CBS 962.96]|uniref:Putative hydrolase or acyltransferase of alpha/beta superfamily n=1 Tax=Dendrothele bispora (strain CBS 962.96) TaxID=1314807 RepID=A0A4S8MPD8_DENBC|nr:putative hydrolase or acyltransferase of alpha/beta superfamily [Dendrothele bispora CBS 962.96]
MEPLNPLPSGITTRYATFNGINCHFLEASPTPATHEAPSNVEKAPLIVVLHGFPELAYSERKLLVPLAQAGYYVVAPDQRGLGRTFNIDETAPDSRTPFEEDLSPFRMINLVKDVLSLIHVLGYDHASAVVGHDFGSSLAGFCALIRPDIFRSVVMMSTPFPGAPSLPLESSSGPPSLGSMAARLQNQLAALTPPRKHYTMYYSTPDANKDMLDAPQGLPSFFRDYLYAKSGQWQGNSPHPLPSASATHLAELPHYYIMLRDQTMPEAVRGVQGKHEGCPAWLSEQELTVYVNEYSRRGFQAGLNWYRCATDPQWYSDLQIFAGKRITVPAMFISGEKDWGTYQNPGVAELMKEKICEKMDDEDFVLIEGAGHWVQQENSDAVVKHILRFLGKVEEVLSNE